MLYPGGRGRGGAVARRRRSPQSGCRPAKPSPARSRIRDEFNIAITDGSGYYRSWPTSKVKVTVDNPLDAHVAQLGKYTNDDLHNVLAYLQTLK